MKGKKNMVVVFLFLAFTATGQIYITPFAGISSTRLKLGFDYKNGGNYPVAGLEIEGRLKPHKISSFHFAFVTGASYLANGYYENDLFSIGTSFYESRNTNLTTTYLQIPLMLKLYWQPFPLMEDFQFYFGAGVSNNFLLKSHLTEKSTNVFFSTDIFAPPQTTEYQDSRDITNLGVKSSLFSRIDFGVRFKRVQVALRISVSFQDMYYQGLENVWAIPAKESAYISGHTSAGTTKEKYSELVVGYRIF